VVLLLPLRVQRTPVGEQVLLLLLLSGQMWQQSQLLVAEVG